MLHPLIMRVDRATILSAALSVLFGEWCRGVGGWSHGQGGGARNLGSRFGCEQRLSFGNECISAGHADGGRD